MTGRGRSEGAGTAGKAGRAGRAGTAGRARMGARARLTALSLAVAVVVVPPLRSQRASDPFFVEAAAATRLTFTHVNGATGQFYLPEVMGSGVALFDYDNDGDLDVFFVQGGSIGPERSGSDANSPRASSRSAAEPPTCRLFRNDLTV